MPQISLDLAGNLTPLLVAVVAFALVAVIVTVSLSLGHVLDKLHKTDRELDIGLKPMRFGTKQRSLAIQADLLATTALARLSDLETAIVSLVEATEAELETRGADWLDYVCESLGTVLAIDRNYRFRVAIWTDDEQDPTNIKGLAYFNFNRHNPKYEKLDRATSLAGKVVTNRAAHYAPDVDKCELYQKRISKPDYRSLFAVPLGSPTDPWAALTVDAEPLDGLDEARRAIVVRFGALATVGGTIIRIRSASAPPTTGV